jgi:beta-lactamase regulating signal transducer with metallopeptidase domain
MNELGSGIIWLAFRVTLLSGASLLLLPIVARRGSRACVTWTLLSLLAVLLLTPLALCPWPGSLVDRLFAVEEASPTFASHPETAGNVEHHDQAAGQLAAAKLQADAGWVVAPLKQLALTWKQIAASPTRPTWGWQATLATILIVGVGVCLVRLLAGVYAVRACRHRARPIVDGRLAELGATLCEQLDIRREVKLFESNELAGPATVGWLRPVILLPPDWMSWTEPQKQAVLAHELAHIAGSDYPAWFVARITLVLHFYHPLVWWITQGLQLHQELAADAAGARLCGNSPSYLMALSQMALRQEGRLTSGPARSFLSVRGTLLRRIAMLRDKGASQERPLSRLGRLALVCSCTALVLAVSALRGPAQNPPRGSSEQMPEKTKSTVKLDYSLVLPLATETTEHTAANQESVRTSMVGVYAFRPAEFFGQPGMTHYAEELNKGLQEYLNMVHIKGGAVDLPVQEIEQMAGRVVVSTRIPPEGQTIERPNSLSFSFCMVRSTKPYDWKKLMLKIAPKSEEISFEGKSYYKLDSAQLSLLWPDGFYFYVPDDKTMVCDTEDCIKRLIHGERAGKDSYSWTKAWTTLEANTAAIAVDKLDQKLMASMVKEDDIAEARIIAAKAEVYVLSVNVANGLHYVGRLRCPSQEDAQSVKGAISKLLKVALKECDGKASNDGNNQILAFTKKMLQEAKTDCEGREATFRMGSDIPLERFVASMMESVGAE